MLSCLAVCIYHVYQYFGLGVLRCVFRVRYAVNVLVKICSFVLWVPIVQCLFMWEFVGFLKMFCEFFVSDATKSIASTATRVCAGFAEKPSVVTIISPSAFCSQDKTMSTFNSRATTGPNQR